MHFAMLYSGWWTKHLLDASAIKPLPYCAVTRQPSRPTTKHWGWNLNTILQVFSLVTIVVTGAKMVAALSMVPEQMKQVNTIVETLTLKVNALESATGSMAKAMTDLVDVQRESRELRKEFEVFRATVETKQRAADTEVERAKKDIERIINSWDKPTVR